MQTELTPQASDSIGSLVATACVSSMRNPNSFTANEIVTSVASLVPYLRMAALRDLQDRLDFHVHHFRNSRATSDWNELLEAVNSEIFERRDPKHARQ